MVKTRRSTNAAGALSPTNPAASSPMYAAKRHSRSSKLTLEEEDVDRDKFEHVPEEDEEEEGDEDSYAGYSSATENEKGVGMISPVADTPQSRRNATTENQMDRVESQRAERPDYLTQPALLAPLNKDDHDAHRRTRIPGGAAAKLMLMGPQKSMEDDMGVPTPRPSPDSSTGSEKQNQLQVALDRARNQVKSQFNMLPPTQGEEKSNEEPVDMEQYRQQLIKESPNLFDPTEVFYGTAEAAINALLTAQSFMAASDSQSVYSKSSYGGNLATHLSDNMSCAASVTSAFQVNDGDDANNYDALSRREVSEELLPWKAHEIVESLSKDMQYPNTTLDHLLQNIATASEGEAPDLGKTVRRKNACGALQVLTTQPGNRIPLAWTTGVLPALTSVLADTGVDGAHITYPDKRHRHEFEIARDRAITCLTNLSTPKENRIAMFHSPHLVHWLVAMILEGRGPPRKGACAILAFLAKTPDNRLLMVQVPRLIEAFTKVLKPRPARMEYPEPRKPVGSVSSSEDEEEDDDDDDDDDEQDNTTDGGTHTDVSGRDTLSARDTVSERDTRVTKTASVLSEPSRFLSVSSSYSQQSHATQRLAGARSPIELHGYDETADELLREARNYVFAALSNLVKEKDNAFHFSRDTALIKVMSEIAMCHESPAHVHAIKFLAFLTRHRLNSKVIVFRRRNVVPALVEATTSQNETARLYGCYALQNLSQDKSCRQELAIAENLLVCLCERARGATDQEAERLAALSALKNLTDEPANLIPMSNTTDCIATLMHLAHGRQEGVTPLMQYRACDALATLSHWLRKIATSGQALSDAKMGKMHSNSKELFVPSLRVVTVNQWQ